MTTTSVTPMPRLQSNAVILAAFTGVTKETNPGFRVGENLNGFGENTTSLTLLTFGRYAGNLTTDQTAKLFGEAYEAVIANPDGNDHQNIRQLLKEDWAGLSLPDELPAGIALRKEIDALWERRSEISPASGEEVRVPIEKALDLLDRGVCRVAFKLDGYGWYVDQAMKKAVLLSFRINDNRVMRSGDLMFYDKVDPKFHDMLEVEIQALGIRVVPPAVARRGSYIGKGAVLMPSYVNIGAHVGEGTMVDTWATVGSCAQIGKNVHLSGGVGIGGVLEPLQANPTIIEDNCFIGARSEVVEGVIVEENSVLSMGVYLSQSTKIYDRATGEITYGRIPAGSVVVPGSLPSADSKYSMYCAVIVKRVDAQTRAKTSINELLRD